MKSKLEWPFNLMADVNKKITDEERRLPECMEDAPADIMAVVSYIFADIVYSSSTKKMLSGASAILNYYRDGMAMKDIVYDMDVSRSCVDQYIKYVLERLGMCERYRKMMKYGLKGYVKLEEQAAMQRGRNLGYQEGVYDGRNDEDTYKRGYAKGYNDGICGMQNRVASVTRSTPIEDCNFTTRAYCCLKRSGINYVDQLIGMSMDELLDIRNMGRKTADEVFKYINQFRTVERQSGEAEEKKED